jgi:hypothetical protein
MFGVFWMQLLFNLYSFNETAIRQYENHLSYVTSASKSWLEFSTPASICLALSLVLLAFLVPSWKPASRTIGVKEWTGRITSMVACLGGFTFFSQVPTRYQDWKEQIRIEAIKRQESKESRELALKGINIAIQSLAGPDRTYYLRLFETVNSSADYRDHGRILEFLVANRSNEMASRQKADSDGASNTGDHGGTPLAPLIVQNKGEEEQVEAIKNAFSEAIGAITPELKGIAGKFVEKWIDEESEVIFVRFFLPGITADVEKVSSYVTQREETFLEVARDDGMEAGQSRPPRSSEEIIRDSITKMEADIRSAESEIERLDESRHESSTSEHEVEVEVP